MNRRFEVTSSRTKYENPWMKVIELETRADGKKGIYGFVERADSATIIIETADKRILFVRQYRFPTNSYSWELPMGSIEEGELQQAAARRELEEETGCIVAIEKIGEFKPVPGLTPQTAFVYYGCIPKDETDKIEECCDPVDEITDRRFLSYDEIRAMIASREISDGFTLSSLSILLWREAQ